MTNTEALYELTTEAIDHAARYGFEPSEEHDGYARVEANGVAVFRVLNHRTAAVEVRTLRKVGGVSLVEMAGRDYLLASDQPVVMSADYLDDLDEVLTNAFRAVS